MVNSLINVAAYVVEICNIKYNKKCEITKNMISYIDWLDGLNLVRYVCVCGALVNDPDQLYELAQHVALHN